MASAARKLAVTSSLFSAIRLPCSWSFSSQRFAPQPTVFEARMLETWGACVITPIQWQPGQLGLLWELVGRLQGYRSTPAVQAPHEPPQAASSLRYVRKSAGWRGGGSGHCWGRAEPSRTAARGGAWSALRALSLLLCVSELQLGNLATF